MLPSVPQADDRHRSSDQGGPMHKRNRIMIIANDPDASRGGLGGWGFGDGPNVAVTGLYPGGCDRHGPWSPPARTPSTWEETLTNTYRHAGTFRASFIVRSATPGIAGCPDP